MDGKKEFDKGLKIEILYLEWIKPRTSHSNICLCNLCLQSDKELISEECVQSHTGCFDYTHFLVFDFSTTQSPIWISHYIHIYDDYHYLHTYDDSISTELHFFQTVRTAKMMSGG